MDPQVRADRPGACPICGMALIEVQPPPKDERPTEVTLSPRARTLARVQTRTARRAKDEHAQVHLHGKLAPEERALTTITSWTEGWVAELKVNFVGQAVEPGQILAVVYSPKLYDPHEELLRAQTRMKRDGQRSSGALATTREWLYRYGVPRREVQRLERLKRPTRRALLRAQERGVVLERLISEGDYIRIGAPLYRTANLDTVWVMLEAYEPDLPKLAIGQTAHLRVEGLPNARLKGEIDFIAPTLDPHRRTAQVRVVLPNPEGKLRPGMFVHAAVDVPLESQLLIPASAPLFTGKRAVVYVEVQDSPSTYALREVRLGARAGDFYPVLHGLSEGEQVVSRGAFMLDADLQLKGGASLMTPVQPRRASSSGPASQPGSRPASRPASQAASEPETRGTLDRASGGRTP